MTWKKQFNQELNRLETSGVPVEGETLDVHAPEGRLGCEVVGVDGIGVAFRRFSLETDRLDGHSPEQLKAVSQRLSKRINYLLEPISPIEIDQEGATVQMRSNPPQQDDDGTKYYELLVRRDGLTLCRYTRPAGAVRGVTPANVTREVLLRLAEDFVASIQ